MKRNDLKRNAFNAVSIVLIIAMVIWAIAFVMHVESYNRMVATSYKELDKYDPELRPELRKIYVFFESIVDWRNGAAILGTGILLIVVGVALVVIKMTRGMNKKTNKGLTLVLIALISVPLLLQMSTSVAIKQQLFTILAPIKSL